jgi:preprotein translocase subunit SecD
MGSLAQVWAQDKTTGPPRKLPDGVYAVLRDSLKEKEVLPLKAGEALIVHRYRFLAKSDAEPPRFLVVRSAADVTLDLAEAPKADKDGQDIIRILLKLRPKAATALERLTTAHKDKPVAIVLGGEVVTTHKIREAIKGGELQITGCAPGAVPYLLERLQARQEKK